MAITFVGSATGVSSATLPTFTAGDIAIVGAMRRSDTTSPALPSGWTTIVNSGAGAGIRLGYRVLVGGDTSTGTWTNAQNVHVLVFRGQDASPIGGSAATGSASATDFEYPAITMVNTDGSSWVVAFGVVNAGNTAMETPPTGMTNRTNVSGSGEYSGHDTNGGVAAWSLQTVTGGGSAARYGTGVVELKAAGGGGGGAITRSFAVIVG